MCGVWCVICAWCVVHDVWCVVCGVRFVVVCGVLRGARCVVWCVVSGEWCEMRVVRSQVCGAWCVWRAWCGACGVR